MSTAGKRILVVEDDDDSRSTLCTMLEALGHTFMAFGSPTEAAEQLATMQCDLALLDIMMPEMNGFELLEKIKQVSHLASIPVIMVTAKDKDDDVLEGYQTGADYYITKPYTTEQINYGIQLFVGEEGDTEDDQSGTSSS